MAAARNVTDEEILEAMLRDPSPTRVARKLGIGRETVRRRLQAPEMAEALATHRRAALDAVGGALVEASAQAVRTLRRLMRKSSPQDSVQLGAATSVLKFATAINKTDQEREERDDVWDDAPTFRPRLIKGGGGDGDPSPA